MNWDEWMDAIKKGDWEGFQKGLNAGLPPFNPPSDGQYQHWPALAQAISYHQTKIAFFLIDSVPKNSFELCGYTFYFDGRRDSYLHLAAQYNMNELIIPLIEKGIDVDHSNWFEWPPYYYCGHNEPENTEKTLLTFKAFEENGCQFMKIRPHGWNPLEYFYEHKEPILFKHVLNQYYKPNLFLTLQRMAKHPPKKVENHIILNQFLCLIEKQKLDKSITLSNHLNNRKRKI